MYEIEYRITIWFEKPKITREKLKQNLEAIDWNIYLKVTFFKAVEKDTHFTLTK